VIWIYRVLFALNAPVLLFSLYFAISVLPDVGSRYFSTTKAIMVAWPVLQLLCYWMAAKAKHRGLVGRANWILFSQFLIFYGITVAFIAMMIAAFPE
jgi:uncharacterized protein (TIGR04206 family)